MIVDGSACMSDYRKDIADALKDIPASIPVELKIVSDATKTLCSNTHPSDSKFAAAISALQKFELVAGQDDSASLLEECQKTARIPGSAVLWIHGAQPVHRTGTLKQFLKRLSPANMTVYDFLVEAGPNEMLAGMNPNSGLIRIARSGPVHADLENLWTAWTAREKNNLSNSGDAIFVSPIGSFKTIPGIDELKEHLHVTDGSLAQLYASQQIASILGAFPGSSEEERAGLIAASYQIVSPVSSAVVADINPEARRSPQVATAVSPEADTWILLVIAGVVLASVLLLQERTRTRQRTA